MTTPQPLRSGKVRDIYEVDTERLIIVASDRISAFDCILPTPIPDKGKLLTALSLFWFEQTKDIIQNHLIETNVKNYPAPFNEIDEWQDRSMLVQRAEVIPVECVARGYLAGAGWKEYQKHQCICGVPLPAGLTESEQLPEPIFTPTTKAESGHDEMIDLETVVGTVGAARAEQLRDLTLQLYRRGAELARERGFLLADTKFEIGVINDELILVDEILTPDSSRFWDIEEYEPGRPQNAFDKQFVRDYLETLDWDKTPPAPELPDDVAQKTADKYRLAYERLTETPNCKSI